MKTLLDVSVAINILGLTVISALESWRPGFVSGAVSVSIVWVISVILISAGLITKKTKEAEK